MVTMEEIATNSLISPFTTMFSLLCTGPPKALNNLETREVDKQQQDAVGMSSPKPVFNGNRARYNQNVRQSTPPQSPVYSSQHEENVKYLSDAWLRVNHEMEKKAEREGGPVVYREKNPNHDLQNFKAFDLTQFWGDRLYYQATGSKT